MSNSRNRRRRRKKRITGRFYAFLSVVVVLVVMVFVLVNQGRRNDLQSQVRQIAASTPTSAPAVVDPAPADPNATVDPAEGDDWGTDSGATSISDLVDGDEYSVPLDEAQTINVSDEMLGVNKELSSDWRNILLLGTDTRNVSKNARTDTMIIASINTKDGRIKLTSLMRDMMVPIYKHDVDKINAAAYFGGPKLAIKTVNEAFSMNITEYMLVNFLGMADAIDILGGIYVDTTPEEMEEINHNIKLQAKMIMTKEEWDPEKYNVKTYGTNTFLNGMQAVGYARIRSIGAGDFQRTSRQRVVLNAILQRVKSSVNVVQLMQLATSMWGYVETNITLPNLVGLATSVLKSGIEELEEYRLPYSDTTYKNEVRNNKSALYDVDLEKNTAALHNFIYNS